MGADFPLPRSELPTVDVSPRQHAEAKELAAHMLASTVSAFEAFTYRDENHVDTHVWKPIGSRDRLRLYKQRDCGSTPAAVSPLSRLDAMRELPREAVAAAADPGSLLLTGDWPGRMENAMFAVATSSQEELALVVTFLHEDVADCAILHTMDGPTPDRPYHFLGYKFFVRKSPTTAHLVRNRDSVYLEACGTTTTSTGEVIGYHIMHSVDVPGFPDLTRRNSVRTRQSVRYIYRQNPTRNNVVEIFMLGSLNIAGTLGGIGPVSTFFTADSLFGITRLVDCAEAKRLTQCVRERQRRLELPTETKALPVDCCSLCRTRKKRFTTVALTECLACGQFVCQRCWLRKKIFTSDGVLGRFHKVCICKTCVLDANASDVLDPLHVSLSRRQRPPIASLRHRAVSSGSSASGSTSAGSVSSETVSISSSVHATEATGTHQAHYHTQYASIRTGSGEGGSSYRAKRVSSKSGRSQTSSSIHDGDHHLSGVSTPSDVSNDLILLDLHGYSSRTHHAGSASSSGSMTVFTPPSASSTIAYSNPVGSYDTTGSLPRSTASSGADQEELMRRMLELHRVVESTYKTTRENAAFLAQRY